MKVVILAGGLGTRLSEFTKTIPKPMIKINGKPLIYHIMKWYAKNGFKDFYIALGYKGQVIKKYFSKKILDWNINLIDTGKNTMTGGRLKRVGKLFKDDTFFIILHTISKSLSVGFLHAAPIQNLVEPFFLASVAASITF